MSYYLLEVGSEEIPAGFIGKSCDYYKNEFEKRLNELKIDFDQIQTGGTPRRLYVNIEGLSDKQKDTEELIMGPPARIAFDEEGKLTKAGEGFAKKQGLDLDSLQKIENEKGEYLAGVKKSKGVFTNAVLEEIVPQVINNCPFQKSMRWGDKDFKYARPVHWFLSVYNGDILPFEIDGIKSGNKTYGHRIMDPKEIEANDFATYVKELEAAKVVLDTEQRKKLVSEQIAEIAKEKDFLVDVDEELLDTVVGLVEYPFAVLGEFEDEFLTLPPEVLITSMKYHQKYFYVTDKEGKVLNFFIGVSNTVPNDVKMVKTGYERVLRARLSDAMFFYKNDKKVKLESRMEELKKVVYQVKLGTSYEKMERFKALSEYFADKLDPNAKDDASRAAFLCKADLMSEMVYEFPELQGIMGKEYSNLEGEKEVVSNAIYEHYLPRFAGDDLPETDAGAFVSMADKLDTICGCFAVGLIPTGNNDPYALRRNAIGIIQIIREKGYRLNLKEIIGQGLDELSKFITVDKEKTLPLIHEFILGRLSQILSGDDIGKEAIEAVKEQSDDCIGIEKAAKALSAAKGTTEFEVIAQAYKRINNILKKNEVAEADYDTALFEADEEKALAAAIEKELPNIKSLVENENYDEAMNTLLGFSGPVNSFFDGVMVMAEDEKVRTNRFGLLYKLKSLFDLVGDLSAVL